MISIASFIRPLQFAIHVSIEKMLRILTGHFHLLKPRSVKFRLESLRPRRRDITVPTGTFAISAISL
jgi:hypothetical protein